MSVGRNGEALSRPRRWRACGLLWLACGFVAPASGTTFPEGIEYTLQAQTYLRHESNPFRFSDASPQAERSDTGWHTGVRAGLVLPLLSERTRLEMSGTYGRTKYSRFRQLDHKPARFDGTLYWHAGDLFAGSFSYIYDDRLYRYLNRTYPYRDMVRTRSVRASAGLRITESLTFPVVSWTTDKVGYEHPDTSMFFNRNVRQIQLALRYAGKGRSVLQAGIRQYRGDYFDRTPDWIQQIDRRYRDREAFLEVDWEYSHRTIVGAQLGYRKRQYDLLSERDANLPHILLRAGWRYSVKTRFDFSAWHRSYPNDEDPEVLYGTITAARAQVRWQPSEKLWLSLAVTREREVDTVMSGLEGGVRHTLRIGPRFEWQMNRNVLLVLDGWHDRTRGSGGSASYINNAIRIGVVFSTDNGWSRPARILWNPECDPPRPLETLACQP